MKLFILIRSLLSKLFFAFDFATGRYSRSVVVLCYHSFATNSGRYAVNLNNFKQQIRKLQKHSDFVSIEDLSLPLKSTRSKVILTIDDGLVSVMDILPFTKENNIPVTLFVLSSPEKANRKELDTNEKVLTWSQIKALHKAGWTIGCHSATHADFSVLSDSDIRREVVESKKILENKLGFSVDSIAYPKGHFSKQVTQAASEAKYKHGFTIEAGVVESIKNNYEIPRTIIDSTHKPSDLPSILSPSWLKFRDLTNRFKLWEKFLS